jgi:hypothetical protein
MANIIKFLLGAKDKISTADKKTGAIYLATGDGNNAHLYYAESDSKITNIAPSFVESQSGSEIVITFEE